MVDRVKREPRELVLPDEIYNKADADYFASLMGFALPKNGEETALRLLRHYQTIENILTASVAELSAMVGERATCFIKLLAHLTSRRRTDLFAFGRSYSSAEIAEYLKAVFIGEAVEKIYLLTFDASDNLSGCHLLGEGTVAASDVLPRKAVERAILSSASSVAIAHNHPFGTVRPSNDDVNVTKHFADISSNCEITLKEHYVVAGQLCGTVNFKN